MREDLRTSRFCARPTASSTRCVLVKCSLTTLERSASLLSMNLVQSPHPRSSTSRVSIAGCSNRPQYASRLSVHLSVRFVPASNSKTRRRSKYIINLNPLYSRDSQCANFVMRKLFIIVELVQCSGQVYKTPRDGRICVMSAMIIFL